MIFPFDSNSRFSDPKAASGDRDSGQSGHVFPQGKTVQPTQRPASNSEARKRAGEPGFSPVDATFERESAGVDPHLDNGFAEVIRKAKEAAWNDCIRWMAYQGQADVKGWLLEAAEQENPYRSAS